MVQHGDKRIAADGPSLNDLVPLARLETFLQRQLGPSSSPVEITGQPDGGSSNVTVFLRRGNDELVLRRPPAGHLLPTSHDVVREFRFLSALWDTDVPVPEPVALSEDTEVIGSPFYIMKRIDALPISEGIPDLLDSASQRRAMSVELIDGLAALHRVDWSSRGIRARPGDYLRRQFARWTSQLELTESRSRVLPSLGKVTRWVEQRLPESPRSTIVHGDYGLHNVLFQKTVPTRLAAVLDWEMATIGDPLADVGWLLRDWGTVPESGIWNSAKELSAQVGFLSAEEMAARYEEGSGISIEALPFYEVFAMWKEVIITEGLFASYLDGTAPNPAVARFETQTPEQVQRILAQIEGTAA